MLAEARYFPVLRNIQTASGVHPTSYSMCNRASSLE